METFTKKRKSWEKKILQIQKIVNIKIKMSIDGFNSRLSTVKKKENWKTDQQEISKQNYGAQNG